MPSHISRVDAQLTDKRCIAFRYAEPSLTERKRISQWHSGEWSTELVGGTSCRLSNECVFLTRHNGQKRKGEHTGQGHPSPVLSHIFLFFRFYALELCHAGVVSADLEKAMLLQGTDG